MSATLLCQLRQSFSLPANNSGHAEKRSGRLTLLLQGGKRTVLVTEYMEKGDLCTALGRASHLYSWDALGKSIALDVARGLASLHARNVVHFDLKSANILLDKQNRAKLADVGLAKTLTEYHGGDQLSTFLATGDLGTFAWAAPEVRFPSFSLIQRTALLK